MQSEERNVLTKLFDIYGNLLSNKQFEVFDKYLNYDIGESELGELYGESRQSIHDAIAKAKKQLFIFEEKCKIYEKNSILIQNLVEIKDDLQKKDKSNLSDRIDEIIEKL